MNNVDEIFPTLKRSVEDLIEDEEGGVPASRLLMLGAMAVVLSTLFAVDAYAAHRSHSSHRSHASHQSGASGHGNVSHGSHESHQSHSSHVSHTSHSNTGAHSNSAYSSEGDVTYSAPAASNVPGVQSPSVDNGAVIAMPDVNQNIQAPSDTPVSGDLPSFAVPASSLGSNLNIGSVHAPSVTERVR